MILAPWQRAAVCAPPPWTPAAVPGCILYAGAYQEARATRGAQPVLVDGDMEAADAAAWTAGNAATLSKQGNAFAGARCLRVAYNGTASPYASQAILINGNRYLIACRARSDGVVIPRLDLFSTTVVTGTNSTDWQSLSGDATTAGLTARLGTNAAAAGYAEWDSVSLSNLSLQSYTPAYTTIPGSVLAQASATAQPWVSSDGLGIRYQGGDMLQWSAAASAVKCLHDGSGGTLIVAVRPSVINAANWLAATFLIDPGQVGIGINYDGASVGLYIGNGTGALGTSASAALALALEQTYVFTIRTTSGANNVNMRVNSTSRITTTLNNPSAANPFFGLKFGAHTAGNAQSVNGVLGHPFVANRVLSDAECTQIENYILAQATL